MLNVSGIFFYLSGADEQDGHSEAKEYKPYKYKSKKSNTKSKRYFCPT